MFSVLQQGPVDALVRLRNSGANTLNYRFQQMIDGAWTDMGELGDDTYDTLTAAEVKSIKLESDSSQVRLRAYASGGAEIEFSIERYFNRTDGGTVPILSL
jgi:hypothetical protein